jgi:hypothetical protein
MKKNFTLSFILLPFIFLSQKPCGVLDMNARLDAMFYPKPIGNVSKIPVSISESSVGAISQQKTSASILSATFYKLTGSSDLLGNLVSHSKPLQYNTFLNAYSFITRKSTGYMPVSDGNAGTIVGFIGKNNASTNDITSWDSTCLWTNTLNVATSAQGGIWKTLPGNQGSLANSYLVASGSVKNGTMVTGTYRASKLIGTAGTNTPGIDMQFFSNTPPFASTTSTQMTKHDEENFSFNSTDQAIWVAGMIYNDINATNEVMHGLRGMHLSKGVFTSGLMVWNVDSIIPPAVIKSNGAKLLLQQSYLAFTPDGMTGYLMIIGVRQGNPPNSANRGMQPIIYKTTNGGINWNIVNGIDFNLASPSITRILSSLDPNNTNTVTVPYFNAIEGIDMTIDESGRLHILSTVCGTAKNHTDSLSYIHQYMNNGETYSWAHVNGKRPLIIDFVGDGVSAWQTNIIDSLDTECPSNQIGAPGFTNNPWANQSQSVAISSGARLQLSNDFCGSFIAYSWAETDTNLTTDVRKFNEFPNIKLRAMRICDGQLSSDTYIVTGQANTLAMVKDKAFFHYMAPVMKSGASTVNTTTILVGLSVSNNPTFNASLPARHFFSAARLQFSFPSAACGQTNCGSVDVSERSLDGNVFIVYPTPTLNNLKVELKNSQINSHKFNITDLSGKTIATGEVKSDQKNAIDVQYLNPGVYILEIRDGNALIGVKKFVKE